MCLYGKALLVLRYQRSTSRSIISLSIITHQMWDDHPFSECNKITKRTVGVEVEGGEEGRKGVGQISKEGGKGMQYMGGFKKYHPSANYALGWSVGIMFQNTMRRVEHSKEISFCITCW